MNILTRTQKTISGTIATSALVSVVALLTACQNGITFSNKEVSENTFLPPFIESSIPANIYKYDLNLLTGMLALQNKKNGAITTYLRAVDQAPVVTIIPDDKKLVYQSIISAKGNALLKASGVTTSITGNQLAELVINQTEISALKDLPYKKILEESKKIHPGPDQKIVYIAAATLYSTKTTIFDQIESDATVEYGPIVGINGKAYKSSNSTRNDYTVYLNIVDVGVFTGDQSEESVSFSTTPAKFITLPAATAPQPSILPTETDLSAAKPAQLAKVDAPNAPAIAPVKFQVPQNDIKLAE